MATPKEQDAHALALKAELRAMKAIDRELMRVDGRTRGTLVRWVAEKYATEPAPD
jgi:hypothetical protein